MDLRFGRVTWTVGGVMSVIAGGREGRSRPRRSTNSIRRPFGAAHSPDRKMVKVLRQLNVPTANGYHHDDANALS